MMSYMPCGLNLFLHFTALEDSELASEIIPKYMVCSSQSKMAELISQILLATVVSCCVRKAFATGAIDVVSYGLRFSS